MKKATIRVVGDAILDINRYVTHSRWSPENANCPIGIDEQRDVFLGGAGNVAAWLAALKISNSITLYGHWGRCDRRISLLSETAGRDGVGLGPGLERRDGSITTKERIYLRNELCDWHQVIRIDHDTEMRLTDNEADGFLDYLSRCCAYAATPFVIVIADYDKGVFAGKAGEGMIRNLGRFVEERGLLAVVNSKVPARWANFPADVLVCNEAEFQRTWDLNEPFRVAADRLIVTQGARGVTTFVAAGTGCGGMRVMIPHLSRPARATEVRDVSGAGDAFLAGLTAELIRLGFKHGDRLGGDPLLLAVDAGQTCAAQCVSQWGVGKPIEGEGACQTV